MTVTIHEYIEAVEKRTKREVMERETKEGWSLPFILFDRVYSVIINKGDKI